MPFRLYHICPLRSALSVTNYLFIPTDNEWSENLAIFAVTVGSIDWLLYWYFNQRGASLDLEEDESEDSSDSDGNEPKTLQLTNKKETLVPESSSSKMAPPPSAKKVPSTSHIKFKIQPVCPETPSLTHRLATVITGAIGWIFYQRHRRNSNTHTYQQSGYPKFIIKRYRQDKDKEFSNAAISPMKISSIENAPVSTSSERTNSVEGHGIRESPRPSIADSDTTLRSVASLTSSSDASTQYDEDTFTIRGPFADGPIGSVDEEPPKNGKVTKSIQCGSTGMKP